MTVRDLLERSDSRELTEWLAFFTVKADDHERTRKGEPLLVTEDHTPQVAIEAKVVSAFAQLSGLKRRAKDAPKKKKKR